MSRRLVSALAWLLLPLSAGLHAQAPGPQVTTSAGWSFSTADQKKKDTWTTEETAFAALTARWGGDLELSGTVESDFNGKPLTADELLSELAITWNANSFTIVTAGKQRLSWGTARVFSAIDSLEPPLDPLDLKQKARGVTGLRTEVLPLDWLSLWFLALPAPRLDDALLAAKIDVLWQETDLSFGAIRSVDRAGQRREAPVLFADFARFFDRFGFYGEAQLRKDLKKWTFQGTGGVQIEFPVWMKGTLRWLTEYHYNGDGLTRRQASPDAVPSATIGSYRRQYLYTGLSGLPLTEKLMTGASVIAGLDGGLLLLSAGADWELNPSLSAGLNYDRFEVWNGDTDRSELSFIPSRNRVSVHLTAWY